MDGITSGFEDFIFFVGLRDKILTSTAQIGNMSYRTSGILIRISLARFRKRSVAQKPNSNSTP